MRNSKGVTFMQALKRIEADVKAVIEISKRKVTARRAKAKRIAVLRPLEGLVHVIREQRVMLDADLADLYKVRRSLSISRFAATTTDFPKTSCSS